MKHRHHKIPRHAGGTDDPDNIEELTIEEHAEAHRLLFLQYGRKEDELAWKGLAGLIGREEIMSAISSQNAKIMGAKNKGRTAHNKGKPMSEEQKIKLRKPKSEAHKSAMRGRRINKGNMGKYIRTTKTRELISKNYKGRKLSKEHKAKIKAHAVRGKENHAWKLILLNLTHPEHGTFNGPAEELIARFPYLPKEQLSRVQRGLYGSYKGWKKIKVDE